MFIKQEIYACHPGTVRSLVGAHRLRRVAEARPEELTELVVEPRRLAAVRGEREAGPQPVRIAEVAAPAVTTLRKSRRERFSLILIPFILFNNGTCRSRSAWSASPGHPPSLPGGISGTSPYSSPGGSAPPSPWTYRRDSSRSSAPRPCAAGG